MIKQIITEKKPQPYLKYHAFAVVLIMVVFILKILVVNKFTVDGVEVENKPYLFEKVTDKFYDSGVVNKPTTDSRI
ncbi:MAG: hypothetical protein KAG96_05980 [Ichthyobacteriaceae bacterium]|nr:hypothetical protein [Ichthyobacteriaceae bacterium]